MDIGDRMMPWRGAYMCRVSLGKNSTDAYLQEDVSWANGQSRWGRFKMFIGEDVQFGNNLDHVVILQFYSSTSTREARLVLARMEPLGIALVVETEGESWNANNAHFKFPLGPMNCLPGVSAIAPVLLDACVSRSAVLGIGDRYHPLPWSVLKYDTRQGGYAVGLDRSVLEGAPTYGSTETPNWSDRRWGEQVHKHYGVRPYWE